MRRDEISKVILSESDIPKQWYNIVADMPNKPAPYHNPATLDVIKPDDMKAIFPDEVIRQEMSSERYIDIPDEVRQRYGQFRPSPLYRAKALEKLLDTPARIYY